MTDTKQKQQPTKYMAQAKTSSTDTAAMTSDMTGGAAEIPTTKIKPPTKQA